MKMCHHAHEHDYSESSKDTAFPFDVPRTSGALCPSISGPWRSPTCLKEPLLQLVRLWLLLNLQGVNGLIRPSSLKGMSGIGVAACRSPVSDSAQ